MGVSLNGRMKVGLRLAIGFSIIAGFMLCVAAIGVFGLTSLFGDLGRIVAVQHPRIERIHAIINEADAISVALRNALLSKDADAAAPQLARVAKGRERMSELLEMLDKSAADEDDAGKTARQALHAAYAVYTVEVVKLSRTLGAGKREMASALLATAVGPRLESYLAALRALGEHEAATMRRARAASEQTFESGRSAIIGIVALALSLLAALAVFLTRGITRPLARAVAAAEAIARGDLTQSTQVALGDETASLLRSLEAMRVQLSNTVRQIKSASDTVGGAATQINRSSRELAVRSESHAATLEQTASSIAQLTATVKGNADDAAQASALAAGAAAVAVQGGQVVGDVVRTMSSINESSQRIADIATLIDDIAFRTNILALNATIESAHAGVHGRAFSVVAGEVRKLAERSAKAAGEVSDLIEESVARIETGTRLVNTAGATMREVVLSVTRLSELVAGISAASNEQSTGIAQVNAAVSHMGSDTQKNAAMGERSLAAAGFLDEQARALSAAVSTFQLASLGDAPEGENIVSAKSGWKDGFATEVPHDLNPVDAGVEPLTLQGLKTHNNLSSNRHYP